jgi:type I restriction enzyme, S subunit
MIEGLNPYPSYKDSGVPWLGEVPKHWQVRKLRNLLAPVTERNRPDLPLLSVVREKGVIQRDTTSKAENYNFIPDDLSNYKVVRVGQFAMNKMKAWQGSYGMSQHDGIVSPAYFVFDLKGIGSAFFHSAIRSRSYVPFFTQASDGVRIGQWDLSQARMKEISFFVPPLPEQGAIVRFLDYMDRRIRRYIRAKQKLIKLLEEQKQAIIHRAVTRGLDPNVRFKPSGVEWLGEVPEHWEVVLLGRFVTSIDQGWSPVAAEGELADNQWAVLTLSSVRRGAFDPTAIKPIAQGANVPKEIEVHNGNLLLTRSNTRERVGDVCVVEGVRERTILCDLIYRLSINNEIIDTRFLMLQLLSPFGRVQIERDARRSSGTMPKISQRHIRSWRVVLPPLEEQLRIIRNVNRAATSIAVAIDRAGRQIALLREYRTRLIADVVTGKIDVRETAGRLPDEAEEPEPLEDAGAMLEDDVSDETGDLDAPPEEADA